MNILEVTKGLKQGKLYQLPGWWRFYLFAEGIVLYIKSPYTEKQDYNLKISEIESSEWIETTEEELKNMKG